MLGQLVIEGAVLRMDGAGLLLQACVLNARHAIQRPAQIDRCGAGLHELLAGGLAVLPAEARERQSVGGGDGDGWSAADHHGPDRSGGLLRAADLPSALLQRQSSLIEEGQLRSLPANGLHSAAPEVGGLAPELSDHGQAREEHDDRTVLSRGESAPAHIGEGEIVIPQEI